MFGQGVHVTPFVARAGQLFLASQILEAARYLGCDAAGSPERLEAALGPQLQAALEATASEHDSHRWDSSAVKADLLARVGDLHGYRLADVTFTRT